MRDIGSHAMRKLLKLEAMDSDKSYLKAIELNITLSRTRAVGVLVAGGHEDDLLDELVAEVALQIDQP